MLKKLFIFVVLLMWIGSNVFASGGIRRSEGALPEFVNVYVSGMEIFKPAFLDLFQYIEAHDVWDIADGSRQEALAPEDIQPLIVSLENLNGVLMKALSKIEPFTGSSNENLKNAVDTTRQAYQTIIKRNEASIETLKAFQADGEGGNTLETLQKIGYEIEFDVGQFSTSLYYAATWVTEEIMRSYWDREKGLVGYPSEELAATQERLQSVFGENITMLEGHHFENAAAALVEFLGEREGN